MSKHGAAITTKALAWWGGGAVLAASAAVIGALVAQSGAAYTSSMSGTTGSTAKGGGPGGGNNGNGAGNGPDGAVPPPKALAVTHTVPVTVRPGRPGVLRVVVTNPNNQAVILTGVAGRVTAVESAAGAGAPCTPDHFVISRDQRSQRIGKGGVSDPVDLAVTMVDAGANQDRCNGATYSFSFTATAKQA